MTEFADPTRPPIEPEPGSSSEATPVEAAKQGASDVASTAGEGAKEAAGEVVTQAKVVAGEARDQLSTLVDRTRSDLAEQADARTRQAAGGLRTLVGNVDALADGRPHDAGPLSGLLDEARSRMMTVADRLESAGPQGVIEDVSAFARRRPLVFLAVAAGTGFAVGRLARAGRTVAQGSAQSPAAAAGALPPPAGATSTTGVDPAAGFVAPPVIEQVP